MLILDEAGRLRGRFSSSAAQSSGLVEADRVLRRTRPRLPGFAGGRSAGSSIVFVSPVRQ